MERARAAATSLGIGAVGARLASVEVENGFRFQLGLLNGFRRRRPKPRQGDQLPHKNKTRKRSPLQQLKSLLVPKKPRRPLTLTEDHILSILFVRRARRTVLGEDLFSDPAWDILLELYAARLGRRRMSLSDLSRAIETPPSTTRRWVATLEERRLISSASDPTDPARVKLSAEGVSKMEHLADHWGSAFLSI